MVQDQLKYAVFSLTRKLQNRNPEILTQREKMEPRISLIDANYEKKKFVKT